MLSLLAYILNPFFLFSLGVSVALCFHIVRTRQDSFWLWIVLMFQGIGSLVYIAVILIPSILGGDAARKLRKNAEAALDPGREYREAKALLADTPTVHNQMRFGAAAMAQGRFAEAEQAYREAATGVHAEDPALLLGRARALIELGRFNDSKVVLEALAALGEDGTSLGAVLARARTLHGLGQMGAAEKAYREAAQRLPGFEAMARLTAYLAEVGEMDEARTNLTEIDRRIAKLSGPFRKEASVWRDLAAAKIR